MRRAIAALALLALAAPSSDALAKPRGCFTKAEQNAELLVRAGLRLRESGIACDDEPWNAGTRPLWEAVDKQFGPQFKQQSDIRRAAFDREFGNDAEHKLTMWNSRNRLLLPQLPAFRDLLFEHQEDAAGDADQRLAEFRQTGALCRR